LPPIKFLIFRSPYFGVKTAVFEPFIAYCARISRVFMLIPATFTKSETELVEILAKVTANMSKMPFDANPVL